jgi:hypothetical protein
VHRTTPWAPLGALGALVDRGSGLVGLLDDGGPGGLAVMAALGGVCAPTWAAGAPGLALLDTACRALPPASLRSLWGLDPFGRRLWFYHYVREGLPHWARAWWDARERAVRLGIASQGRVEQRVARLAPLWRGPPVARRAALRLAGCRAPADLGAPGLGDALRGGPLLGPGFGLSDAELAAARAAPTVRWADAPPPLSGLWIGDAAAPAAWLDAVCPGGWVGGCGDPRIPSGWTARPLGLRSPLLGEAWAATRPPAPGQSSRQRGGGPTAHSSTAGPPSGSAI